MILSDHNVRVWLCLQATDMRKSFRGLIGLVKRHLSEDPLSGHLFVFINKRKTYMKILYHADGGFCIWMKKLTQGQFAFAESNRVKRSMSWQALQCLIDGIEFEKVSYRKRYRYETQSARIPV